MHGHPPKPAPEGYTFEFSCVDEEKALSGHLRPVDARKQGNRYADNSHQSEGQAG
jgi:hypothetical protein